MNYIERAKVPLSLNDIVPSSLKQITTGQRQLLDAAVISDIESEAVAIDLPDDERPWYDIRPMLDEREHSLPFIDAAVQVLRYAMARGLISYHPDQAHLVHIEVQS